jgi:hypothetical protein
MPIPTRAQWEENTKRSGKTRSKALKAVDQAIGEYHLNTGTLQNIKNKLDAWKGTKDDWTDSIRNKAYKDKPANAVSDLIAEVDRMLTQARIMGKVDVSKQVRLGQADMARAITVAPDRARAARAASGWFVKNLTQTQTTGNAAWTTKMRLIESGKILTVETIIRYRAKPSDAAGATPSAEQLQAWKSCIKTAWDIAKLNVPGAGGNPPKVLDIVFEIVWATWDSAGDGSAYGVDVVDIAPPTAPPGSDWRTRQAYAQMTLDGATLGTPHMAQWGIRDRQAVVHEYGHIIGNPDEYDTTHFNGVALDSLYNQTAFTTQSIMNDTRKGVIYARHFKMVKDLYAEWRTISPVSLSITGVPS